LAPLSETVNVVVLAGGINRIDLFEGYTPDYKALLTFADQPSIRYVLEALEEVPNISRICLVGPEKELRRMVDPSKVYKYVHSGENLLESLVNGLEYFHDAKKVLLVTADLPLITPRAVSDFIESCLKIETSSGDEIFWAMVPQGSFLHTFPNVAKGFNRFRDISVCHGNLLMIAPSILKKERTLNRINAVYDARKNSLRAALAVGLNVGLAYLFGVHFFRLFTLEQMAGIVSRRFGIRLRPILLEHPEVAIDVDEPTDYLLVKEHLER